MITLEQEVTTLDAETTIESNEERIIKDSEESFSATLKKAIDLSANTNNNEKANSELNNKQFYYSTGPNNFLIEKDLKAETLKNMPINQIPFTPEWFMGIVSIRGVIMPVINISEFVNTQTKSKKTENNKLTENQERISQEESNQEEKYLLKLEHNTHSPIVIKIDKLPKQLNISNNNKRKAAKTKPSWMLHTIESGSLSIIEIDHNRLLNQIKELS